MTLPPVDTSEAYCMAVCALSDQDFSDTARDLIHALRLALTASEEQAAAMRKAMLQAVEVIQTWHNMGMSGKVASDTWDIYWRNAPEMKPIREALKEA